MNTKDDIKVGSCWRTEGINDLLYIINRVSDDNVYFRESHNYWEFEWKLWRFLDRFRFYASADELEIKAIIE